ncbi:MAG: GNAT family N-acetyltransferase [Planctomycetaceae bacterium]|nr:GNAT family N-acetyltransferase [Planctomycetaceae bacterium]
MDSQPEIPAFVDGDLVMLRPLVESDLTQRYLDWLNDAQVSRFLESGTFPETMDSLRAFYNAMQGSKHNVLFAIIDKATGKHIGNVKLGGINWIHRYGDLGIMVGDKAYWHKGYGREACRLLLKYAFGRLNLNKVWLGVYGNHAAAIRSYEKVGFVIEGRMSEMLNFEGAYVDKVIMAITKRQFAGRAE